MTEQEYIYVRDLSNVMVMRNCLKDLNPGHSVMTVDEHKEVMKVLKRWEERLFEKVVTKDE